MELISLDEYSKRIGRKRETVRRWIKANKILPCAVEIHRKDESYEIVYDPSFKGNRMVQAKEVMGKVKVSKVERNIAIYEIEKKRVNRLIKIGKVVLISQYCELLHNRIMRNQVVEWIRHNIPLPGIKRVYHIDNRTYLQLDKNIDLDLLDDADFESKIEKAKREDTTKDFSKFYTYHTKGIFKNAKKLGLDENV